MTSATTGIAAEAAAAVTASAGGRAPLGRSKRRNEWA